jgi:hypothetical protein
VKHVRISLLCLPLLGIGLAVGCGSSNQPVRPAQDFTLTVSPSSLFAPIGVGGASVQISVQAVNGFSQSISVSFTGLPTGVSTSPAMPLMLNPGTNQTITLTAASGTLPAVQTISVQATSGTLIHAATFSLSAANPSYAYVASGYTNEPPYNLVGFAVDANQGTLSAVPGSPTTLPSMPLDLAVASENGGAFIFVLVPDSGAGTVSLNSFSIAAATGMLTALQTINYPANTFQSSLAVHPSGKFLYVVQQGCILAYVIDPSTGNLTQSSCSTLQINGGLVLAPPGNFAYQLPVTPFGPANWSILSVNQSDGSLTLLQSMPASEGGGIYTDPQGRALYELSGALGTGACGTLEIWSINSGTGALTQLSTSLSPLCDPMGIAFNPADTFALISSIKNVSVPQNGVYVGAVDPTTGNLTNVTGSPFASGIGVQFGAVEPSQGNFLLEFAGDSTGAQLLVYSINAQTGALTQVGGVQGALPSPSALKIVTVAPNP